VAYTFGPPCAVSAMWQTQTPDSLTEQPFLAHHAKHFSYMNINC